MARTADELEEEEEEEEVEEEESEDEDENAVPYNPKNLPLGFDGKPIPYWLYKLHGLNITYECEICGGAQYKGPKSFQRHFSVRHSKILWIIHLNFFLGMETCVWYEVLRNTKHSTLC